MLKRGKRDQSARITEYVRKKIGRELPQDLADLYRENVASVGDFAAIAPIWNDVVGWRPMGFEIDGLLDVDAVPLFWDGCGSVFGLDLSMGPAVPAVYFFDHDHAFSRPAYAAGSSLGVFLLLLADHDRSHRERWPTGWELKIDPDIDKCPRAPAIWDAI